MCVCVCLCVCVCASVHACLRLCVACAKGAGDGLLKHEQLGWPEGLEVTERPAQRRNVFVCSDNTNTHAHWC